MERSDKVERGGRKKERWEESVFNPSPESTIKTIQGMGITNYVPQHRKSNPHENKPVNARKDENNCCFVYILVFRCVDFGGTEFFQKAVARLLFLSSVFLLSI